MANGRCKRHGGKAKGPPKGSQNGMKHGIYGDALSDEEKVLRDEIVLGSVDEELRICRIKLRRCLILQKEWDEGGKTEADLELSEISRETDDEPELPTEGDAAADTTPNPRTTKLKRVMKRPNFESISDMLLARIGSLERARYEISRQPGDASNEREIKITVIGGLPPDEDDASPT